MTKLQTILCLFIFLIIVFSMDMVFGNNILETFTGISSNNSIGYSKDGLYSKLNYSPQIRTNTKNGNLIYSGKGFLGDSSPYLRGDDQPLYFGFSST